MDLQLTRNPRDKVCSEELKNKLKDKFTNKEDLDQLISSVFTDRALIKTEDNLINEILASKNEIETREVSRKVAKSEFEFKNSNFQKNGMIFNEANHYKINPVSTESYGLIGIFIRL